MIKHYGLAKHWLEEDIRFLKQFGIEINPNQFWINTDDEVVFHIIKEHCNPQDDFFDYEYSKDEILSSEYCVLDELNTSGYPKPEYEYRNVVYDPSTYCIRCDMDHKQIESFKINKRSKKDIWHFFSGALDATFVTEDLYKSLFKPRDIGCRKVLRPSGKDFEGVLQLDIPIIKEGLDLSMHEYIICRFCGRKKYIARQKYPFFPLHDHPLSHIYMTEEHFGYGATSHRKIIISNELTKILLDSKQIKLNDLIPCRRNLAEYLKTINY